MKYTLKKVTYNNNHIFHNLSQNYEAEFSYITGQNPDTNGIYEYQECLEENSNYWGYIFYCSEVPAGFIVINKIGQRFDVAEFYIAPSFRRKKLGTHFFYLVIKKYPGEWQVRQLINATKARLFWISAIKEILGNDSFSEDELQDPKWKKVTRQRFSV